MNNRLDNIFAPPALHYSNSASSSDTLQGENALAVTANGYQKNVSVNEIYKRTEVIGRGKFGVVYKGYDRKTNHVVAIKVLNLDTDHEEVKEVQQEIQFLSQLKAAPNIIHYYGSYLSDTKLWIIMDHCAGGSVRSLLKPGRMDEKYIGVIVRELLIALQYVHKAGVIHRDLKAANVLITKEGNVQLCDFGVAAQLTSTALKRTTMAGTPYWMAPEVIMEGAKYDVKVDIWSLGITIYEIATGNPPYSDKDAMRAMQLITKSKPPRLEGRTHSSLLKEMIALCLDENPDERQTADDLLKSRFVRAHKNTPTTILKEIISRYLIWREKKSSRDSMALYGMDEELDNNANPNSSVNGEGGDEELDVKWDFDSLSSSEYIMENDINVNQINNHNNNPDFNQEIYNDDDYFMMTSNQQQTYMTGNDHPTSKEDPTLRMTASATVGHTIGTRKEAPKSLLHLFQEEDGDENSSASQAAKKNDKTFDSIPQLPTLASSNIPRSSSPMIEIPNMDDITASEPVQKGRSRAPTLSHTQSAAAVLGRVSEVNDLPTSLQRRPTLSQMNTPVSAPPPSSQTNFPLPPASLTQSKSSLSNVSGRTPSPKRSNTALAAAAAASNGTNGAVAPTASSDNVNLSPQRISGMTASHTMKPLPSSVNMSALLQPINKPSSDLQQEAHPELSSPTPVPASKSKTKNISNLHLKMPAPTSVSPSLLTNYDLQAAQLAAHQQHQRSVSSSSSPAPKEGARVNQFGIDAVQVAASPLTMTPLNEKSQANAMNAFLNGGKVTPTAGSITPPRETRGKASSLASSVSRTNTSFFMNKDDTEKTKFPELPEFNTLLLIDGTENCKAKLLNEINSISDKLVAAFSIIEDDFNVFVE